tara:strand:+ start:458 stop:970 length:513 start_codon:yes stop_codon:yes gene_type:complete
MDDFIVTLGSIINGKNSFSFEIKDKFFDEFIFSDITHANICVVAIINKDREKISLDLTLTGHINKLPCDICTEELSLEIYGETNMMIQKTEQELLSNDEILYVKKNDNKIDLKHLIFELIVINMPQKRQHPLDKNGDRTCNKKMLDLVKKYTEINEKASDPRWDVLKNLK